MASPATLFLIFNRPDTTAKVFEAIRQARPARLYVAADGPRPNRPGESERCNQARQIVSQVDWPCEVHTLFRETNFGCRNAVSSAITWFFEHEAEGIILEDDCLPDQSFFRYCAHFLDKHRHDDQVMSISGSCFFRPFLRGRGYCYTYYPDMWGWATWRRAWGKYDVAMSSWPQNRNAVSDRFPQRPEAAAYWSSIFDTVHSGKIDTWDFQWIWCVLKENALAVTPLFNMIRNVGFGPDGTHTLSPEWIVARRPLEAFPTSVPDRQRGPARDTTMERYIEVCRLGVRRKLLVDRISGKLRWMHAKVSTYSERPT